MPTKKLDAVIYYEKYVVIQPGVMEGKTDADGLEVNGSHKLDLLTEDEYIDIIDNQISEENDRLDDSDPNKFIAKMGAEAIYELLQNVDLDNLSYDLRDRAGRGGSIYLRGNHNYWTLLHLKYQRHFFAEHGGNGGRDKCHGTDGKDIYIDVPCGTVVYNAETGKFVCDVAYDGQEVLLLKGGRGGLGNFQFRSATNQAPRYAQPGEPMQEMTIIMELKLLADVGLVGFPNAGKSTLLSAVSSARPKIANYPFTTLEPSLGIVDYRDHQSFVMADIPGIIEGASEGKGLGLRFLRHIERNSLLLFMVPGDTDDIKKEYEVLLGELKNFNPEMLDKHRVLAITKCDLLDDELIEMLKDTLPTDLPVVFISSVTGQGIQDLKDVLWKELNSESNKLQEITAEDTLVHRDKDMSRFQQELEAEGEDIVEYIDEDEIEDVDDLDDFEYE